MQSEAHTARARRYLLGALADEDAAAVEREYLQDPEALESLSAAEDELIEDYLGNRLAPAEYEQFTRAYLAAPHRRRRVETVRQLLAAAQGTGSARDPILRPVAASTVRLRWLAAAVVILATTAGLWFASKSDRTPTPPETPGQATGSPLPSPQTFVVSISPTTVRAASATPSVVIPSGTDIVTLSLEGEVTERVAAGRASIHTAAGNEVWRGATTAETTQPEGVIARVNVPASRLPVDDYVITLFRTDAATGTDTEVNRYFLRVRAR